MSQPAQSLDSESTQVVARRLDLAEAPAAPRKRRPLFLRWLCIATTSTLVLVGLGVRRDMRS